METEAAPQSACHLRLYIFYFYPLSSYYLALKVYGKKKKWFDTFPGVNLNVYQMQDLFLDGFRKDVFFSFMVVLVFVCVRNRR